MVSVLDSGLNGLGSSPGRGHCVVFLSKTLWVFSICTEKPVVPVKNQMEQTFPLEIFRKKSNTFRVVLFSRFYRNDRKILFHLPCSTSAMLLGAVFAHETNKHGIFVDVSLRYTAASHHSRPFREGENETPNRLGAMRGGCIRRLC